MAQYLERAASMGRDAMTTGMKAGSMVVEKAVEVNQQIISGNARFFEQPDEKIEEVRALLDNKSASKKLEGMKRLIAVRVRACSAGTGSRGAGTRADTALARPPKRHRTQTAHLHGARHVQVLPGRRQERRGHEL